ncbi:ComEA family DNA-binding protein [Parasporobacterium paucivorans]|uniref:Competence protein ComEA n=1 Tax=Parasporobacterium paucivorans DSM 15970 TaxID=1122934 RepID=A0A1M6G7Z5_9FIRM|nr:ComEA family DNA-binding protein [Parasporobacterium paucivorans]SHJ06093.1 competence protein ComEA [Parasporobacterium paucivorans DSM 15970]
MKIKPAHAAILGASLLCGLIYAFTFDTGEVDMEISAAEETDVSQESETIPDAVTEAEICVYICGYVNNPGVYFVKEGTRLFSLVETAGGFSANAAGDALNLADAITDGQKIYVPSGQDVANGNISNDIATKDSDGLVNINTADISELITLPGIGEARAKSIIAYREMNGRFKSPEEIMKIDGIKDNLFEKIRELIKI